MTYYTCADTLLHNKSYYFTETFKDLEAIVTYPPLLYI